ncbi:alpha/beta hydrolase [Rubinisphaera margarita]|uniref:alpha/beta hydrolase n=1 Tax=Rubinisphaera margarita TaxID=2909586 RepID=UPI001EE79BFA|nr:alpha/beta hydrolase [Rubinisphaera margarita]MCG6155768.1 alpha/beta hydrolase [Rubinisphaera margarita]
MPLDDQARLLLDTISMFSSRQLHEMTIEEARSRKQPVLGDSEPMHQLEDIQIPTRTGSIPARVYRPTAEIDPHAPLMVFIHGGGWVLGKLDDYDQLCRALAAATGSVLVSLDYRLAPESPYPCGLEDCIDAVEMLTAAEWTAHLDILPDADSMILAGDSAGGNLAAVVAHSYHGHGRVHIAGQILLYPVTDCDLGRASYQTNAEGYLLTTAAMKWFWEHYCPDELQRGLPTASPLQIDCCEGLPPTFIVTCEFDPLRDEGHAYANRLIDAGTDTIHHDIPGMIHGFMRYLHTFPQAQHLVTEIAEWVSRIPVPSSTIRR